MVCLIYNFCMPLPSVSILVTEWETFKKTNVVKVTFIRLWYKFAWKTFVTNKQGSYKKCMGGQKNNSWRLIDHLKDGTIGAIIITFTIPGLRNSCHSNQTLQKRGFFVVIWFIWFTPRPYTDTYKFSRTQ